MINKREVGVRIGNLRRKLRYSQAEFSEIMKVSPQAVSKWETGLSLPDIDTLLNMSWIFKTSINHILVGNGQYEDIANVGRETLFLNNIMICPACFHKLSISKVNENNIVFQCVNEHKFAVVDGVVDFRTREIIGEQWSLSLRNYDEYLHEQRSATNPNYERGLNQVDVIWEEIQKYRPKIILDMACGTGQGIKHIINRINWPVTVIMVDISHRILKWNKIYYSTECKNPFVDMVYLACDGSNLPLPNESVDLVFSYGGYESMQAKMMNGFREAYRVLKNGGCTVYTKSVIEDFVDDNSIRWMNLLLASVDRDEAEWWKTEFIDINQWLKNSQKVGFAENAYTKIYGELPAPNTNSFPFENEMAQWMSEYVATSIKRLNFKVNATFSK